MAIEKTILTNPVRNIMLVRKLVSLWEDSVRHSHYFLTASDIEHLQPIVREAILQIETLIVVAKDGEPVAFMGIAARKIEMLFVVSVCFGQGLGRQLVDVAIRDYSVNEVDVNEQNPAAQGFYERLGFAVYDRTEYDEQGNHFPIFRMRLP